MYAQVIVDIAHSQVDRVFEYSCPEDTRVGCRVKAPFGGRIIDGNVIGQSQTHTIAADKINPVTQVYHD